MRAAGVGAGGALAATTTACAIGAAGNQGSGGTKPSQTLAPATLNVITWAANNDNATLYLTHLFDGIKKALPQLTVSNAPAPQGEVLTKLLAQAAAGTAPDSVMLRPQDITPAYNQKLLAVLDTYLKRDAKEINGDDFFPAAIQRGQKEGKQVAFPTNMSVSVPQFNKTLFTAAGVKPPDDTWTWDTYLDAARRIAKRDPESSAPPIIGTSMPDYQVLVWAWGGQIVDQTQTKFLLDEDKATTALQWWADLKVRHAVAPLPSDPVVGNGNEQNRFLAGQLGMLIGGITVGQIELITTAPPWDVFVMPKGPAKRATLSNGASLAMTADSKQKEAAWAWIKYAVSPEIERFAAVEAKQPPSRKSALAAQSALPAVYNRKLVADSAAFAQEVPYLAQYDALNKLIGEALAPVQAGQKSAFQAMREIKPQADALLMLAR